jgi:WD40 repeat protein
MQAGVEQLPTRCSQVLRGHSDEVWALAFSHDGRQLASASKDGAALLWRVGDGAHVTLVHTLAAAVAPMNVVAFSPDDRMVLTGSCDGRIYLFDAASGAWGACSCFVGVGSGGGKSREGLGGVEGGGVSRDPDKKGKGASLSLI